MHHEPTTRPATRSGDDRLIRRSVIGLLLVGAIGVGSLGSGPTPGPEVTTGGSEATVATIATSPPVAPDLALP